LSIKENDDGGGSGNDDDDVYGKFKKKLKHPCRRISTHTQNYRNNTIIKASKSKR